MSLFFKLTNGRQAKGFISWRYFSSFYEIKVNYLLISTPLTATTDLKALSATTDSLSEQDDRGVPYDQCSLLNTRDDSLLSL